MRRRSGKITAATWLCRRLCALAGHRITVYAVTGLDHCWCRSRWEDRRSGAKVAAMSSGKPAVVWVAETWAAHGEESRVQGVYDSREAAEEGLKGEVDTLYVTDDGDLAGKPRDAGPYGFDARWAAAYPMEVRGRTGPERSSSA